jgi:hypothetical protein
MTAVVGNTPVRAAVAQSPVWMRGGSLGYAWRRARGEKRKGGCGTVAGNFEAEAARQRRGGLGVVTVWRAGTGKKGGPRAWCGTARQRGNGPQRPGRSARGQRSRLNRGGAEGLTGGPRP